jgi:hypothetical protein
VKHFIQEPLNQVGVVKIIDTFENGSKNVVSNAYKGSIYGTQVNDKLYVFNTYIADEYMTDPRKELAEILRSEAKIISEHRK